MATLDDIRAKADEVIEGIGAEDIAAGADLFREAVADAVNKVAAEAVAGVVEKLSADVASVTPEDLAAGADLIREAVAEAVQKAITE